MTISDYLQKSSAYTTEKWVSEMESLMKAASSAEKFPFIQEKPLPENTNLVTGSHRYDLNAQRIELFAASTGMDRTLWAFAADAEILGLEAKDGQKPLLMFSNIIENPSREPRLDAHQVYLIDQFTPESISRIPEYAHPESIDPRNISSRHRYILAKMALLNIANYDSGISDQYNRLAALKNIKENSNPKSAAFEDAGNTYRHYVRHDGHRGKNNADVFNALRKYYICQVSGNPLNAHKISLPPSAFLSHIPATIKTMFNARIFVKRLENQDFFLDYSHSNPPRAAFIQIKQAEKKISPSLPIPYPERTRR
jgi:hypothetical protein